METKIEMKLFGKTQAGQEVYQYTLKNKNGVIVKILDRGGIITNIICPDKNGNTDDVILGFDNLAGYEGDISYQGALIGRYGNRIKEGKFILEGKEYTLAINNGPNHLHGGLVGFDKVIWETSILENENGLKLTYTSKDMEEGYPGTLNVEVKYILTDENELKIIYAAKTDKTTVLNLTNHAYFNLAGAGNGTVLDHVLSIDADKFTELDENTVPTGRILDVKGTANDFLSKKTLGQDIEEADGIGYDLNFVINGADGSLKKIAEVEEPKSGRKMEVFTTEPGVQLYSGNYLDGFTGRDGKKYNKRGGFCLETQHFPDSPNQPQFPSTELKPGEEYAQITVYKFGTI